MKKLFLIFASIVLIGMLPSYASAASYPYEDSGNDACEKAGWNDPMLCGEKGKNEEAVMQQKVGTVLDVIYGLIGVVAVIFIIIGGFKYTTSQGDPERVQVAKRTIMYSIIGLVVTLSAFAITGFALGTFTGSNAAGGGGGGGGTIAVESLTITSSQGMAKGKTMQLKVRISPDYATNRQLAFASSDTSVATIDGNGLITAKKAGSTTITAVASNGVSTSMKIEVTDSSSSSGGSTTVTSLTMNPKTATVAVGGTTSFSVTISPSSAANTQITWTSSKTSVATVDSNGTVKGVKAGTATITAAAGGKSATATVTVTGSGSSDPPVSGETYSAVFEKRNYSHSGGKSYDYWINIPQGATSNMALVVFLHGDGEMNNANAVKNLKWVQTMKNATDYISIAPVGKGYKSNGDWAGEKNMTSIKGLIDKIVSDYKINKNRIYLWGFSRGAIGVWEMVDRYGSFFRAVVPVSCCGSGTSIEPAQFKNVKVYALAGSKESDYVSCMTKRVNSINSAGGSAKFESVSGAAHDTITANFPYSKVIDGWLLKQ